MIKQLLGALALSMICTLSVAEVAIDRAPNRVTDLAALQNGAKLFVNDCLSCHSANNMRYNKLEDLGLTEDEIKKNLLFTREKVGDRMTIAMQPEDGKEWFGTTPPDLSVLARAKNETFGHSGVDYIYTYLRSFYRDTTKKTGWDNAVFPSVAMPNVLWRMESRRSYTKVDIEEQLADDGKAQWVKTTTVYDPDGFSTAKTEVLHDHKGGESVTGHFEGSDAAQDAQFANDAADLANFLGWMAEPVQIERKRIGVWVMLFLFILMFAAWRMNRSYWKDIR